MYPDPRVVDFITREFVPDRAHIKQEPQMWHRFGTRWTPTVLVLDSDGKEVRRIEGFLPADELRREASRAGVTGIPTFFFGDEVVVGCQPYPMLARAAERAGAKRRS